MSVKRASPAAFTLLPRGLEVTPADLFTVQPSAITNQIRSQVNRAGADEASGWLVAGIHSEFDPTAELFTLHVHGIAARGMIDVVDELRSTRPYCRRPPSEASDDRVAQRIRMTRKPLTDLPRPLTYLWQSFWPSKARGDDSDDDVGFGQLHRDKRRIPEPYHTQMLLWLDRQRIEDMTLLINLSIGRDGFSPSARSYINRG